VGFVQRHNWFDVRRKKVEAHLHPGVFMWGKRSRALVLIAHRLARPGRRWQPK
jgi:hypothetical protein